MVDALVLRSHCLNFLTRPHPSAFHVHLCKNRKMGIKEKVDEGVHQEQLILVVMLRIS